MSRRRTVRQIKVKDTSKEAVLEALLDELCVVLGFCLPPDAISEIRSNPPVGVDDFTDAVIRAEGMDPILINSGLRRRMREIVSDRAGRIL